MATLSRRDRELAGHGDGRGGGPDQGRGSRRQVTVARVALLTGHSTDAVVGLAVVFSCVEDGFLGLPVAAVVLVDLGRLGGSPTG